MVLPPGLLRNNLRMTPDTTACTGVPLGARISIASCGCPEWISSNVSRSLAAVSPSIGSPTSGNDVAPELSPTVSTSTNNCAARIRWRNLFLRNYGSANHDHMREIDHIPVCKPDAPIGLALPHV